jgi:hypothetical protein
MAIENTSQRISSSVSNFVFDTKFNQTKHEFEIYLQNTSTNSNGETFPINPNAIVNLNINGTLSQWFTTGTLSFFYYPEAKSGPIDSRTGNRSGASTGLSVPNQNGFYVFSNDGNDLLRIRVTPKVDTSLPNSFPIKDTKHWTLSYLFSVYDMEDVDLPPGAQNAASANLKCLKVYFWDYWFQKLNTNILEYSTALSEKADIEGDKTAGVHSNYGMIPTGIAMKEIIEQGLEGVASSPIGSSRDEWEDGASRIFYTAPAQTTAYESLTYVYEQHISSKGSNNINDVSILVKEKGPGPYDTGYLTLRPLQLFFQKSTSGNAPGEWQIEHFFLQSYTDEQKPPGYYSYNAPISNSVSDTVDVKLPKYNTITNYRFVDIATILNSKEFCSSPVYSFDFLNRVFRTEFQNNTVYNAKSFITENYINRLYKTGGESSFLINLDQDKENKNLRPEFSLYGDTSPDGGLMRQLPGIQKLLYLGVFQNACINFRTLGLTHREPGRFIAIDKTEGVQSGPFEDRFFGQWLIIDIKHIFETELYYNDITAVRVHRVVG